jgi:excinuclease ABC subunit C
MGNCSKDEDKGFSSRSLIVSREALREEMDVPMQILSFDPAEARVALDQLPTSAAVFALYGAEAHAEPYIGRTPNLRARLDRLLQPSARHPRRLQLASRVRQIRWRLTGSEFESLLVQFELLEKVHGAKALERMHLRNPAFVRFLGSNAYPRITVTHRPSQRESDWAYGPFASRAAAERFADETLKLFLLRRCTEELDPHPSHPGCVYSEMKMCLAPCFKGCTEERYAEEAAAVQNFLATRGESRLVTLRTGRDAASANLEFEFAAALHAQAQRVEAVRALAPELVRPLSQLRAVILQASTNPDEVAVFVYENGSLRGPAAFSTLGMRIQNENSGSSSLFAHPMAIEPILEATATELIEERLDFGSLLSQGTTSKPALSEVEGVPQMPQDDRGALAPEGSFPIDALGVPQLSSFAAGEAVPAEAAPEAESSVPVKLPRGTLEARMETALAALGESSEAPSTTFRQGHLALLKRWYYRPEVRRRGEIFFPDSEGGWPVKALLRGVGRVAVKRLAAGNQS